MLVSDYSLGGIFNTHKQYKTKFLRNLLKNSMIISQIDKYRTFLISISMKFCYTNSCGRICHQEISQLFVKHVVQIECLAKPYCADTSFSGLWSSLVVGYFFLFNFVCLFLDFIIFNLSKSAYHNFS